MYTYDKKDKSYTFSFDEVDIDKIVELKEGDNSNNEETEQDNPEIIENYDEPSYDKKPHKKIEVINGGNDLDISPVSDYLEVEKPRNEKKENIVVPEDNK